jgi:hypothetical protein
MPRLAVPLLLGVLLALSATTARDSAAQEIFSWWRRDLLDLDLRPGAWTEFEIVELSEGQQSVERVRCRILDGGESDGHWLAIDWPEQPEWFVLKLAVEDSLRGGDLLDGLIELYRMLPGDAVVREDVTEVREDRLLRRHFQDLFEDPSIQRRALADTTIGGTTLHREELVLHERREDRVKMGSREVTYVQEVESVAQLSPQVPLFGLLGSETRSVLSSEGEGRDAPPPLITESRVTLLGFGIQSPPLGLPAGVEALRDGP